MRTKEIVAKRIVRAFKHYFSDRHFRVFYFGSRVRNQATVCSDYDIGVEVDKKIPLEVLAQIEEDIEELPILQKIDIVDFGRVSKDFARMAKKHIEVIYEQ